MLRKCSSSKDTGTNDNLMERDIKMCHGKSEYLEREKNKHMMRDINMCPGNSIRLESDINVLKSNNVLERYIPRKYPPGERYICVCT